VREGVCQTIMDVAAPDAIEFFHGYTYSAHPVACAAAIATLRIYQDEDLFARARALSPYFLDLIAGMRDVDIVTDTRGYGLLGAFDLAPAGTPGARGFAIVKACFAAGVVVRVAGDTIILAPPFVAERSDLDQIFGILRRVLATV
jgi:beta-alanine--pyruvate transaminase